jgi:hypothetical protein
VSALLSGQANPKELDLPRDSYLLIQPTNLTKVSAICHFINTNPRPT